MLMPPGQFDHLRHFRLSHFKSVNAADAYPVPVDMEHDLNRLLARFGEETLQHMHDEFHRRVIVVEDKDLVQRGLLGLRTGLGDDTRTGPSIARITIALAGAADGARAQRLETRIQVAFAHELQSLRHAGGINKTSATKIRLRALQKKRKASEDRPRPLRYHHIILA